MNRFLKLSATFVVLPAVVALSLYSLEQHGFFKIDQIKINVSVKSSQKVFVKPYVESLNKQLETFKGQSLWELSLGKVSDVLKKESWVTEFRVSRAWPSGLEVEIEPHEIAYLVQAKETSSATEFFPVTANAQVLQRIDSRQAPPVAIVRGDQFLRSQQVREGAIAVLKSLPAEGRLRSSRVSEVGYDKKDGYWISLLQSDTRIKFGEDQFELKSNRVSQVIDYLENRDLKARVIDANLSKKVLVRLH